MEKVIIILIVILIIHLIIEIIIHWTNFQMMNRNNLMKQAISKNIKIYELEIIKKQTEIETLEKIISADNFQLVIKFDKPEKE